MDVVTPVAFEYANPTLPLALRSLRKHAPHLGVVLLGHTMAYDNLNAQREFKISLLRRIDQPVGQPIANTDRLMRAACEDAEISDPFVWTNDDIYWRRPVTLEELVLASNTAKGDLPVSGKGMYYQHEALTRKMLSIAGLPTYSYERHVPLLVHKAPMLAALEFGGSKRSVYGNMMNPNGPVAIEPDVKLFDPGSRPDADWPWFSTGNDYPPRDAATILAL